MNIEIEKQIDAPPERVFTALTDADELARWFASSAESDPRTGGDYVLRFEFEDESRNHTYAGQYEDVTPPERVRYPWNGRFGDTTVEFTLRPARGGTQVTLRHSGWTEAADEARQLHAEGWTFFLDNLERYLTGADDQRDPTMRMRTTGAGARAAGP
jgi:uncharacterized protein YndB with AHSA1/START domain